MTIEERYGCTLECPRYQDKECDICSRKFKIQGATEQKEIDMTLFLELCERWKKIYLRKCQSPSEYSRTIAPGQCDAIDLLLQDVFKGMGIDEETFRKAHREE